MSERFEKTITVIYNNPKGFNSAPTNGKFNFTSYGESIEYIVEDEEGKMWAVCEDEPSITQINFNPFTGTKAKVQIND